MKGETFATRKGMHFLFIVLALSGLYLTSRYNYLLFHSLAEIFSIVVACGIFIVAWNSRRFMDNNYLLFIGIAYLFIALIDLLHTLAYKGMPIFPEYGTNLPTQLWIGARYMESLSLFLAPMLLFRQMRARVVLLIYSIAFSLFLFSVYGGFFPTCFIEGTGLTPFKKISEYVISLILLGAIIQLYKNRSEFDRDILILLVTSISVTIAGEIAFTFYISAYGISNLLGHYLKIASFYLIYRALIKAGLTRPYDLLFRNLQKSAEQQRSIIQTAMDGYWLTDNQGQLLEVNETYCRMSGYSEAELLKMNIFNVEAIETADDIASRIQDTIAQGESRFQSRHQRKDGNLFDVEVSVQYRTDGGGRFVCFLRDITDRKKTEDALKESEQRYKKAQQIGGVGNWEYDLVTEKFWGSDEAKRIYGFDPASKDFTTEQVESCILERERVHQALVDLIEQNKPYNLEIEIQPINESNRRIIKSIAEIIKGDSGAPIKVAGVIHDVTTHKQMEVQLQQAQKMESIGTLAGGIAHDFNNILFPIVGNTEMLLEDIPEDSPLRRNLNEVFNGAMRAKDLVKQILAFSRQDSHEIKLMRMQPVIKEALKLIRSTIPTSIEIEQTINHDCGPIKADPTQIHQVVMNLATNAYHAMEDTDGELKVNLKEVVLGEQDLPSPDMEPGPYACLTVTDSGTGIDDNIKDRIFDPYYTTKEQGKGTGMGLAVIHGIVKNAGGSIHVYSEPGKGTEFHVYLPIVESSFRQQEIKTEEPVQGGTEQILLVDDEEAIAFMEKQMLERLGYSVVSRTSSVEALEAFRVNPDKFDVVITDMAMPNMSGDKLASELIKIRPDIPVVLCTGFSERMPEDQAESMGIKGFLMKPIVKTDLSKKIREVLENKEGFT